MNTEHDDPLVTADRTIKALSAALCDARDSMLMYRDRAELAESRVEMQDRTIAALRSEIARLNGTERRGGFKPPRWPEV